MGMSTLAELNAFASDPFTVPLSALINDYGLAQQRQDRYGIISSIHCLRLTRALIEDIRT